MRGIVETLKSQDFLEKILLLVVTAILTGFTVPLIMDNIAQKRMKEQKKFEADLLLQTKVLESQVEFFNNISEFFTKFQLLALEVSYYKYHENKEKHEIAFKKYDDQIWDLYTKINAEIDKSRRLISERLHKRFADFYQENLIKKDTNLVALKKNDTKATEQEWNDFHTLVGVNATKSREILNDLAKELRLAIGSHKEAKSP